MICFSTTRRVLISLLNDSPSPPNPFSHTRTRTTYPLIKMPSKYIKIHSRATNPRFPKFNLTRVFCTTSPYQDPKKSSRVPSKIQDVATSRLSYLAPSTYAFTTRYGTDKKVRGAMKSTRQESVRTTEFNREIPILRPTRRKKSCQSLGSRFPYIFLRTSVLLLSPLTNSRGVAYLYQYQVVFDRGRPGDKPSISFSSIPS